MKWIDVKDKLPKIRSGYDGSKDVLVTVRDCEAHYGIYVGYLTTDGWYTFHQYGYHQVYSENNRDWQNEDKVVAWAKLPKPYNPSGERPIYEKEVEI